MDYSSPQQNPTWTGFLVGLLGGFAVSSLLIGLLLGYSFSGGLPSIDGSPTPPSVADVPDAPTPPAPPAPTGKGPAEVSKRDHVRGNPKAKITVIEYSDFECPFCKRHAPTMAEVLKLYKDDVNFVYRHFPLSFHQNAQKLAEGSECAAEIGGNDGFWKFHDAVFEGDAATMSADKLPAIAKGLGMNEGKFKTCLDSGKHAKYVQDQMQEGIEAGVQGTPGNFVVNNTTKEWKDISGAVPVSSFQSIIDAMLKS